MSDNQSLTPDLDAAIEFLELIDPDHDRIWYFSCIHPHTKQVWERSCALHGKQWDRVAKQMAALNADGYGVFVKVNHGGRLKRQIDRVDVLYLDFDQVDDGHLDKLLGSSLRISLIVESSVAKHHGYVLLRRDSGVGVAMAEEWMMRMLRHFGADNLHDVSRLMRVPGFYHTKHEPWFMTRILPDDDLDVAVYSKEEVEAWIETMPLASTPVTRSKEARDAVAKGSAMGSCMVDFNNLPDNAPNEVLIAAIKSGVQVHPYSNKLIGRMVKDGKTPMEIAELFADLGEALERVRPGRGVDLLEPGPSGKSEFVRMYEDCMAKEAVAQARRAEQKAANEALMKAQGSPTAEVLSIDDVLATFVYLIEGGGQVCDLRYPQRIMTFDEFAKKICHNKVWVGDEEGKKGKSVPLAKVWLYHKDRQEANTVTFEAGGPLFVTADDGATLLNTWRPWSVEAIEGDATPFLEHVRLLFGDRADDFLDFVAHIVQCPGVLPSTAWLHISTYQGTGRNWLASLLLRVMRGRVATNVNLAAMLDSGYNGRISQMCLTVVDEIRVGGGSKWTHAEELKQMITQEYVTVNPKYGRQRTEKNANRLLMLSNHRSAIPIETGDRRIQCVIHDAAPMGEAYFTRLYGLLDDPAFISACMYALAERDISAFRPGAPALATVDKLSLIGESSRDDVARLLDAAEGGWEYPLATYEDLAMLAGAGHDAGSKKAFAHAINDGGWVWVAKTRLGGRGSPKVTIYCRKGAYERWKNASPEEFRLGLALESRPTTLKAVK